MREKIILSMIFIVSLGSSAFATFGVDDPANEEDVYLLEGKIKDSTDIIVGDVEIISCLEKTPLKTVEDLDGTFGIRKYKARVLPCISLKGSIVIKKEKMKFINIYFRSNISPFLFPDSIYKPSLKTGFLYTTGLYIFFLKHIKDNDYEFVGHKFSALPFFPIKNTKKALKTPWDIIVITLTNKKVPLNTHNTLFQFLMKSDISAEKKQIVKQVNKKYIDKKIIEMKNELKNE